MERQTCELCEQGRRTMFLTWMERQTCEPSELIYFGILGRFF